MITRRMLRHDQAMLDVRMAACAVALALGLAGCKPTAPPPVEVRPAEVAPLTAPPLPTPPPKSLPDLESPPILETPSSKPVRIMAGGKITPVTPEAIAAATKFPAESDWKPCSGTENYPWPRPLKQVLLDVPPAKRRPSGMVKAIATIDPDGKISHLRFTNLSTLDEVNKYVMDDLRTQKYVPTVWNGKRVAVCSQIDVNVDFDR